MPDLIPYALTLIAAIAGGWALYKWGSATGNAKAERAEDNAEEAREERTAAIEGVAKAQAIEAGRPVTVRDAADRLREMRDE